MSALGQKQTCAAQNAMSALPKIATEKADFRNRSCLLYPRKRTCAVQEPMSAMGQKRTYNGQFYLTYLNAVFPLRSEIPSKREQANDRRSIPELLRPRIAYLCCRCDLLRDHRDP